MAQIHLTVPKRMTAKVTTIVTLTTVMLKMIMPLHLKARKKAKSATNLKWKENVKSKWMIKKRKVKKM